VLDVHDSLVVYNLRNLGSRRFQMEGKVSNPKSVSPSAISVWQNCKRKYYQQYKLNLPRKPSPGADLGEAIHGISQKWILCQPVQGDSRAHECAKALFPILPVGLPDSQVEVKISLQIPTLPPINGRVDHWEIMEWLRVSDIKTTSNFQYCKTEEQLLVDPQAVIYCTALLDRVSVRDKVKFRHLYVRTTKPYYTKVVEVTFDLDALHKEFMRLLDIVGRMVDTWNTELKYVEGSTEACGMYGGCDYTCHCAAEGIQTMGAYTPRIKR
jgi:hypothetical protein